MHNRWCALFDWDGVIVNTSTLHERSWDLLAQETGHALPPGHFQRSFGMRNEEIIPRILGWSDDPAVIARLALRKEELFREDVRRQGMDTLPGVRDWLARLDAAGIPRALASSAPRKNIEVILDILGLDGFGAVIAAEDVTRGKPAPDVFLAAARALGFPAEWAVVFEDAPVGVAAGRAAGMRVVAVTTTHPADRLAAADRQVARLDELTVDGLGAWFA